MKRKIGLVMGLAVMLVAGVVFAQTYAGPATYLDPVTMKGHLTVDGNESVGGTLSVNTIAEKTAATGVTIDGVLLKDAGVTGAVTGNASTATALASNPSDCAANQFANTIAANGNLTCAAIADADVPDALTISGGTVNNSVIGGVTPAAGSFTSLNASTTIHGTSATGIGWKVISGANTACNTTCGISACAFGFDTAAGAAPVECDAATADVCVCTGAAS